MWKITISSPFWLPLNIDGTLCLQVVIPINAMLLDLQCKSLKIDFQNSELCPKLDQFHVFCFKSNFLSVMKQRIAVLVKSHDFVSFFLQFTFFFKLHLKKKVAIATFWATCKMLIIRWNGRKVTIFYHSLDWLKMVLARVLTL